MKPHSLQTASLVSSKAMMTRAERLKAMGWAGRHGGHWPKGTVLPQTQAIACPRVKVADLPEGFIPPKYYERSNEQNQSIASCCRHPENHEVSAWKTHPDEELPDVYKFHCSCGKTHVHWLVGVVDDVPRPIWNAS
jgi:hypothetical protein